MSESVDWHQGEVEDRPHIEKLIDFGEECEGVWALALIDFDGLAVLTFGGAGLVVIATC